MDNKTRVYGIALVSRECYGHGDFGDEAKITAFGSYGSGAFPPCFLTKKAAEDYISQSPDCKYRTFEIVEMELRS